MFKNVSGQKITLLVIDVSLNAPKTGDSANLTAYVSKDDGSVTVLGDTSATELDATNAPGLYSFDLTQAETNADKLLFSGKSSTANVKVIPSLIYNLPASFTSHVAQTGDNYAVVNSGTHGNAALKTLIDTLDNFVDTEVADIQSRLPAALVSGRIDASVGAMAANVLTATAINADAITAAKIADGAIDAATFAADAITAAKIAADVTTELQAGLATAAALSTVSGLVDDLETRLTATRAGYLDNLSAGAAALQTSVDDLEGRLTAARAGYLDNLNGHVAQTGDAYARLGAPAGASVSADLVVIDDFVDALESRLTATRAGYLDNLSAGAVALEASLQGLITTVGASAAGIATAVWGAATRLLTAGTNIVLAKGTGVTGFNDLSAAQVNAEADTALADVGVTTTITGRIDAAVSTRATPAQVNTEVDTALADYDGPTNAEMEARTIAAANYATAANLATVAGYIDTEVAAIIASIAALNNLSTAQVLAQVEAALTATIADSVPADGTRPSISSGVYMLVQFMLERSVSGTTATVRKPDGSTTLFTLTLNDAVSPTAVTRA